MHARQLQDQLQELLEAVLLAREDDDDPVNELAEHVEGITEISTYGDAGIMTTDKGLVIEADDGSEYQVTIVQSRVATRRAAVDEEGE